MGYLSIVSRVVLELPKMQCACVTLAEKLKGRLNLLCTFPGGHWIRANIPCKVVCLFKQETLEGARCHCGNEVGNLRRGARIIRNR